MSSLSETELRRLREALRERVPELKDGWFVTLSFNCPATGVEGSPRTALRRFADRVDSELLGTEYFGNPEGYVFFAAVPERRKSFRYHLLAQFNDGTGMNRRERRVVLRRAWASVVPGGTVDMHRALWRTCEHASRDFAKAPRLNNVIISTTLHGLLHRRSPRRAGSRGDFL